MTLILLTGLSLAPLNLILPSPPCIAEGPGASYAAMARSVGGCLAVAAPPQLVMGPLSDRLGRRPVLLASLGVLAAASVGCALATAIGTLLVFRTLQGAVIGGAVVAGAVVRDMRPPREAAGLLGTIVMAMAAAPMLTPVLGGVPDQPLGWPAGFRACAAMRAALRAWCSIDAGKANAAPAATFEAQSRACPDLVQSRRFWGHALCLTFSIGAFYVFLAGAPFVAGRDLDLSLGQLVMLPCSITAGFALGSLAASRLAARHALTTTMVAGRLVAGAGLTAGMKPFAAGVEHLGALVGAVMGEGLTSPSAMAGVPSVRPGLAGSASGLSRALVVGGGVVLPMPMGAVVGETSDAAMLLGLSLAAALAARRIEGLEAQA